MPYEILPHTADLKIAVRGDSLHGLYQAAVDALREVLVGASHVEPRETKALAPGGEDPAERFFRFVRELVYLYDVEGFLPVVVVGTDPPEVAGVAFDPTRHEYVHQVKALTRHQFVFRERPGGYRAEMVLDL